MYTAWSKASLRSKALVFDSGMSEILGSYMPLIKMNHLVFIKFCEEEKNERKHEIGNNKKL
jgi:hypothetical protein